MGLEITDEAVEVLKRSLELAGLSPARAGVRLRGSKALGGGFEVQVELAEAPGDRETVVEAGEITLFVDPEVIEAYPDAIVAVEPQHEVVVVRPASPS